jgi:hypothetical protein
VGVFFMEMFSWPTNIPRLKEVECHTGKNDSSTAVFGFCCGEYTDGTRVDTDSRNSPGSVRKR